MGGAKMRSSAMRTAPSWLSILVGLCWCGCQGCGKGPEKLTAREMAGTYTTTRANCIGRLDIRADGSYRQTVWEPEKTKPVYAGSWEAWSMDSDEPDSIIDSVPIYKVTFANWWIVNEGASYGTSLDALTTFVQKRPKGDIRIMIGGHQDYWKKITSKSGEHHRPESREALQDGPPAGEG